MSAAERPAARSEVFARLRARPEVDVLVVGGGVNGAGTFRDLALQGVDCLLVERDDWCAGASAAPSRLIHGGLKYLETGEFRLVAESTRERNLLLRNAPHLVVALPTALPIRSVFAGIGPSLARFLGRRAKLADRGLLVVEAGLLLYDWLGRRHRTMPRHSVALRATTRRRFPAMAPDVIATSTYYDARVTQPERLVFELVDDGTRAHAGALAANYAAVTGAAARLVTIEDRRTGERFAVRPRVVINAAGPWIDRVNHAVGIGRTAIGGTKGSHLVVEHPELVRELDGRMVYFGSSDGRICLVYPFFGRALIGSTDLPIDDPDDATCDDAEVDYMLAMVGEIFPGLPIARERIVYRYAGVRPLPAAGVADPGEISRDHSIVRDALPGNGTPVFSLVGGKWTTFRAFSEQAADAALAVLDRARRVATTFVPIGGGRDFPATPDARAAWAARVAAAHGIEPARAEVLLERYGTRAEALVAGEPGPDVPLRALPEYGTRELAAVARAESVVTLGDLVLRRLPIAVAGRLSEAAAIEIAAVVATALGWSDGERDRQLAALRRDLRDRHGVDLAAERERDGARSTA